MTVTGLGLSLGNPEKEEEGEAMEDDSGDAEVGRDLLRRGEGILGGSGFILDLPSLAQ